MEWKEFVTAWAKQERTLESLELTAPLTDEELQCVLAMFPDVGTDVEIKDACGEFFINDRTFKTRNQKTYIKCGLPTDDGKRKLRNRLIAEFNRLSKSTPLTPDTPTPKIDWLQISHDLLTHQKNLTTNLLQLGAIRNINDVHVPLGLMERKERPKVKQEPSPEAGSQLYQETELTETKRFEHDDFLAEVVENGRRIANISPLLANQGRGKLHY